MKTKDDTTPAAGVPPKEWIVKLTRRRDGKKYYFRHDGCTTARLESSMRLDKEVAMQLAAAIRTQHPVFTARAMRYDSKAHETGKGNGYER